MPRPDRLPYPALLLAGLVLLPACGPSDFARTSSDRTSADRSATAQQARVDSVRAGTGADSGDGVETALATQPPAEQDPAVQAAAGTGVLMRFNLKGAPARQLQLPKELGEISGIAFDARGRLFAHGDEDGTIWQLDPSKGTVLKRFALAAPSTTAAAAAAEDHAKGDGGKKHHDKKKDDEQGGKKAAEAAAEGTVHADFEDIQVVGDRIYLIASTGQLYQTREGADGERVPFTLIDTGLGAKCEIEGMSYDEASRALLLLCKHAQTAEWRDKVVVLGFSLERRQLEAKPRLVVDYADLARVTGAKAFHGSALVRAPRSGNFVMIAGPQEAFAEVSSTGRVLGGGQLDRKYHRQPEGLAFAPDGSLLMSDEAAGKTATLSIYTARP